MTDIILVDEHDNQIGTAEKLAAHKQGRLHRAFSIFVFNTQGELLMQKRAAGKYHSALLWSNSCCSHPSPGEETLAAAHRRLQEEMGFDCPLTHAGHILYRTEFENGLTEHEYDHMYIGLYDGSIAADSSEAAEWKWQSVDTVFVDMQKHPEQFTYWFRFSLEDIVKKAAAIKQGVKIQ